MTHIRSHALPGLAGAYIPTEQYAWRGQQLTIRPLRAGDRAAYEAFLLALDPEDVRQRMMGQVRALTEDQLRRFLHVDQVREVALAAILSSGPRCTIAGVVRAHFEPGGERADFAIIVRSDLKGRGIGSLLLAKLIEYCRQRGIRRIAGETLAENAAALALARRHGFSMRWSPQHMATVLELDLSRPRPAQPPAPRPHVPGVPSGTAYAGH